MCESSLEQFCKLRSKLEAIIHPCDHNIFIKNSSSGNLHIIIKFFHKYIKRIGLINRHNLSSDFIIRSVKRNSETRLRKVHCKSSYSWNNSTSRNGYSSIWKIEFLLRASNLNRLLHIFIVDKWFPHSHIDDVSEFSPFSRKSLNCDHNLIKNFVKFEISSETKFSSCTKSTSHRTTNLRRNTQCRPTRKMSHNNRFYKLIISGSKKEFRRLTIIRIVFWFYGKRIKKTVLSKQFSNWLCDGRNIFKICHKIFIDRVFDLPIAKRLLTVCSKKFFNFYFIVNWKHNYFLSRNRSIRSRSCGISTSSVTRFLNATKFHAFGQFATIFSAFNSHGNTTQLKVKSRWSRWEVRKLPHSIGIIQTIYNQTKINATIIPSKLPTNASCGRCPIDSVKLYSFPVSSFNAFAWRPASYRTLIAS